MFTDIDTRLTHEHRILQEAAHRFARDFIRPAARAAHASASVDEVIRPDSLWWSAKREARRLGYHLAVLPKAVGGLEVDPLSIHILLEEFGWGSTGLGLSIFSDAFPAMAVLTLKPENKRLLEEIVLPFVEDIEARMVSCAAISEPDHGSDGLWCFTRDCADPKIAFGTRAMRCADGWTITGQKSAWVSNAPVASHALTWVTVCDTQGQAQGGGLAIVPLGLEGVSKGKPTVLLGSRDFPQCALFFDAVRIPEEYLLVAPEGYEAAMDGFLNIGGLSVGVAFVGLARAAFEEALAYAKQRVQGGRPIAEHPTVQLKLFEMFTKVEAARALSRQAMQFCLAPHRPVPIEYSTAVKIYCTQVAYEVAHDAVQIHGACGLSSDLLIQKLFCDARSGLIGDGCNEALALKRCRNLIENYQI